MIITLREFMTWTDTTVFELWVTVGSILASSALLVLKLHDLINIKFMMIFMPVYAGFAINFYFLFIIFMRACVEYKDFKSPFLRLLLNCLRLSLCATFTVLMVSKIGGEFDTKEVKVQMSYGLIFVPLWVLMAILSFQVCRSTNN
ncbi:unnamed protein product [Caenorhabditis bovis]|uniref:Uncharacterized protein n=1 Tax=Caenorhabditis bovis TaxID=2654633 RepID=A0A8S1F4I6_9PELO|nr:unnamed protein product [Caenorhabditis bovis]